MNIENETSVFDRVFEQEETIQQLRISARNPLHAYLFVGPRGSGRWEAAKGFAALILSAGQELNNAKRVSSLVLRGQHPDLIRIEPTGNQYRDEEVQILINEASRTPIESPKKIVVADRFHTANATAVGRLLKTLEEPPSSTIIILISENIPDEQTTIASRCMTLHFQPISSEKLHAWLKEQGLDDDAAQTVAMASGGDLHRAIDLMNDPQVNERYNMWQTIPRRLSGTGYIVAEITEEIRNRIDDAQIMINQRHVREIEELTEREESFGIRGSGRKNLETKHKREIRRFRMDELQFGFSTLTKVLHRQLLEDPSESLMRCIEQIRRTNGALRRNPNESLLLQALLISLSADDE